MDINDQKGPQIDQLSIIHLLFKKFLWFFDFYVVGQGDQQNDKVGQGDQLMEIVGHESFTPPTRADFGAALYNTLVVWEGTLVCNSQISSSQDFLQYVLIDKLI